MKPLKFFAVASQQVATHPILVLKLEATVNSGMTAGLYLQIFDSVSTPAEGTVPVKCWPAAECSYKEFKNGDLSLSLGCYICLSTTAATKTLAIGVGNTMDILEVEISSPELPVSSTFIGDLTTPVSGLQVWTEAAGLAARQALLSVEVDGTLLTTATQFVMIFATDTVNTGDAPCVGCIFPIKVAQVLTRHNALRFGDRGKDVFSIDNASPNTQRLGCTIKISSTPSTFTAPNGTAAIKAEYKTAY